MMKSFFMITTLLSFSIIPLSAFASNFSFLNDTPISYFTSKDWELFDTAMQKALDDRADGSKVTWKNATSGTWGIIVPFNTTNVKGVQCRYLKIFNEASHRTGESTYRFCKTHNVWKAT